MLYGYFSSSQSIIEDHKWQCRLAISRNGDDNNGGGDDVDGEHENEESFEMSSSSINAADNNGGGDDVDGKYEEEESFEIEEEIKDIERIQKLSKKAQKLAEKLPSHHQKNNSHLNNLNKEGHVKDFFEGKTPKIRDLKELDEALQEAKKEKIQELNNAKDFIPSPMGPPPSPMGPPPSPMGPPRSPMGPPPSPMGPPRSPNIHKSPYTLNKKDFLNNPYSDYKLANNLLFVICLDLLSDIIPFFINIDLSFLKIHLSQVVFIFLMFNVFKLIYKDIV